MNVFPVIVRELRAEARNAITYGSRPLGAALLLVASMMYLTGRAARASGGELFIELHQFLLVTIWVWVPIISADCISREKREQTLGLLFLTPLKAGDIMLAKTLAQGLRAATIGIAVIPVLMLPVLMGGINWAAVASSLLITTSAFCWALAAGLLASVLGRTILGSLLWAFLWAAVFVFVLSMLNGIVVFELMFSASGRPRYFPSMEALAGSGLLAMWHGEPIFFRGLTGLGPAGVKFWLLGCGAVLLCSLAGLAVVWQIGALRLQKAWQELPPSRTRVRVEKEFCQPRIAVGLFRSLMKSQLNRNPIGWLERRRWTSRVAAWIWLALFSMGYTTFYLNFSDTHQVNELNSLMTFLLIGGLAVVSAASFRRERETGVMELLLTTPLTPEQIVRGRLFGLWAQFLPSVVTLILMAAFSTTVLRWTSPQSNFLQQAWFGGVFFISVPVCGLWLSLAVRHYVLSLLLTAAASIFLPVTLMIVFLLIGMFHPYSESMAALFMLVSIGAGLWGAWELYQSVGWLALLVVGMACFGVLVLAATPMDSWGTSRRSVAYFTLLTPFVALGVAGFSHRKLLSMLRHRTFGFKV